MDFELTNRQKQIRAAAREFAEGEFPGVAREYDRREEFPKDLWEKACGLGFIGLFLKKEYGGLGLGFLEFALVMEEFWRVDPGCGNILLTAFGSELIQLYGTDEQKRRYLPPLTKGKAIMGTAITEPDAGSDILSILTLAKRDGDFFVINGSKQFITNGSIANYLAVFCQVNPEVESRLKRFGVILVETDRPGFSALKITGKMGIRASDTAEIRLNDVRVPKENLIGMKEGEGFSQIMQLFNINRVIAASQGVGVAQGALDKAAQYVKKRKQFGQVLGAFQAVQFKIAEMATWVEAARILCYQAAWMLDHGKVDPKLISIAKYLAGEIGVKVTNEALQLHGGYGYIADYDIERFYRDAKIVEIYEGTKEIEKNTIARELLGKL
ncbi:MAG TPA: acyl-CoA dehydrogenase family protein [Thermodesulfobacteriota bacterium]|nr:acyl-CoA dehydrogenase family protein [Thermodesulfobacteriota bacterium]